MKLVKRILITLATTSLLVSNVYAAKEVSLENKIGSLYISFFNRAPDYAGLDYWNTTGTNVVNAGGTALKTLKQLSAGFVSHPTFTSTYNSMDDETFVNAIYNNALGRDGDAGGINYWKGLLNSGKSRSDMVAEFMEISLTADLDNDPQYASLSAADKAAAQERQDLITNKVEAAVYFTNTLGENTNLDDATDAMDPASLANDAAYLASQKVIADVGLESSSVEESKAKVNSAFGGANAIERINKSWNNLQEACIQVIAYATNPDTQVCTEFPTPCDVPDGWSACVPNVAPVSDAGIDQTVTEGRTVTLDASSSSDSDGSIVAYEWKEGDILLSTASSFTKSDFSVGIHTLILTVTDNNGATHSDSVMVTVKEKDDVLKETPTYINLSPSNSQILSTQHPIFTFERNINNTSSVTPCDESDAATYDVKMQIVKVDPLIDFADVLIDKIVQVPNECIFEIEFPSLTLDENVGYIWSVGEPDAAEDAQIIWSSFAYSAQAATSEDTDSHLCEKNIVNDATFNMAVTSWKTADPRNLISNTSLSIIANGHDDVGAAALTTPHEVIFQKLDAPIEEGKHYQLKFSLKHQGKSDFQIKALAFNGDLNSLEPDFNTSLIALTGTMTYNDNWMKVILNPWLAHKDFENIAIAIVDDQNRTINALIDRVCLSETNSGGCEETIENPITVSADFDFDNSDPVVTDFEYLLGSVADLNPNEDTDNSEWFLDANSSSLECTTIGEEEYTNEELLEFENQDANNSAIEDARDEMDLWILDNNDSSSYDNNDTNLTPLRPLTNKDCKERIVDYSKPFSGRDIVYVHGLQKNAIDDLTRNNVLFPGRWPLDPEAFIVGGEYYNEAEGYWRDHILATLGSTSNPSNSYLMVTWSALQRAHIGVNAILNQIKDAREGNNPGVHLSPNAESENQCFGDNGIVFVTHSTGGMIVSRMFGEMELLKNTPTHYNHVEPALEDLFDAQVGFNAAYGGSGVATAGLMTTHRRLRPDEAEVSVLVDLGIPSVARDNRAIMNMSEKPTFMLIGSLAGPPHALAGSSTAGSIFVRGYNDSVLASWVQSAHVDTRPKYWFNPLYKHKLMDKGAAPSKAVGMVRKGRVLLNPALRRYYVSPAFSPSGMIQEGFLGYRHERSYLKNHYPIIQTTGDHYDNVNEITQNGVDYYRPSFADINNDEETSVVYDTSLYTQGYLSEDFRNLQNVWIKKRTWGLHLPRFSWVIKERRFLGRTWRIRVPKVTWYYREYVIWKRTYHLLQDYQTKRGADYMYDYILKP